MSLNVTRNPPFLLTESIIKVPRVAQRISFPPSPSAFQPFHCFPFRKSRMPKCSLACLHRPHRTLGRHKSKRNIVAFITGTIAPPPTHTHTRAHIDRNEFSLSFPGPRVTLLPHIEGTFSVSSGHSIETDLRALLLFIFPLIGKLQSENQARFTCVSYTQDGNASSGYLYRPVLYTCARISGTSLLAYVLSASMRIRNRLCVCFHF